ncbi:fungal hydrophobin [Guyanagaster necrorhizus]|uniref:Hydrophobin n=1 Tax=Guyanagaster necrorhizus TaxID=856835 RepID=A0A9P7VRX0_9AGAR|nr:fungal hydrophobin [Guyanagaster necrorhizus MCA 3950]KAG7445350.1 fungal hydrophobin [Guyanagaster necrorhizus MCA 3950]
MFARISAFSLAILALPLLVASSAVPKQETNTNVTGGMCNTGSAQCCKSVQDPKSEAAQNALGLVGVPIGDITANVGLTCDPITVIGLGTTSCSNQPVCCENNSFNGVVALGCTPINVAA